MEQAPLIDIRSNKVRGIQASNDTFGKYSTQFNQSEKSKKKKLEELRACLPCHSIFNQALSLTSAPTHPHNQIYSFLETTKHF